MPCNEHRLFGRDDCAACRDNERLAVLEDQRAALEEANRLAAQRQDEQRRAARRAEAAARKREFETSWTPRDWEAERRAQENERERRAQQEEWRAVWAEQTYGGLPPASRRQRRISGAVAAVVVLLALMPLVGAPATWTGIAMTGTAVAGAAMAIRYWTGGRYLIFRFGAIDATGWMLIAGSMVVSAGAYNVAIGAKVTTEGVVLRSALLVAVVIASYFLAAARTRRSRWQADANDAAE